MISFYKYGLYNRGYSEENGVNIGGGGAVKLWLKPGRPFNGMLGSGIVKFVLPEWSLLLVCNHCREHVWKSDLGHEARKVSAQDGRPLRQGRRWRDFRGWVRQTWECRVQTRFRISSPICRGVSTWLNKHYMHALRWLNMHYMHALRWWNMHYIHALHAFMKTT